MNKIEVYIWDSKGASRIDVGGYKGYYESFEDAIKHCKVYTEFEGIRRVQPNDYPHLQVRDFNRPYTVPVFLVKS